MAIAANSEHATTPTSHTAAAPLKPASRAVLRDIEAGSTIDCLVCRERIRFQAKVRNRQIICNVYEDGKWLRVEHYHDRCYEEAGSPYGEADTGRTSRIRERLEARAAAAV